MIRSLLSRMTSSILVPRQKPPIQRRRTHHYAWQRVRCPRNARLGAMHVRSNQQQKAGIIMNGNTPSNILGTLNLLLEQVEAELRTVNRAGAVAFDASEYNRVREALERASHLSAYRERVASLRNDWQALSQERHTEDGTPLQFGRVLRTPQTSQ